MSSSLVQKPQEARTSPRPGRSRTTTPCSASRATVSAVSSPRQETRVAWPGSVTTSCPLSASRARQRSAASRAPLEPLFPGLGREGERGEQPGDGRRRRPRALEARGVVAELVVRELPGEVRGERDAALFETARRDVERAGRSRPEQPLLRGDGVEVGAELLDRHGDRAGALRAVDEHRDAVAGQLADRQHRAVDPGDVRDPDQARPRRDLRLQGPENVRRRQVADRSDLERRSRGDQPAEQPGMLRVGRHDLVAGPDPQAAHDDVAALGRRARQRDLLRRRPDQASPARRGASRAPP